MKSVAHLVFAIVFFFNPCISQKDNSIPYIKVEQFKIANITLGSNLKAAEKTFGKPDSIEAVPSKIDSVEETIYYFDGVAVLITDDKVGRLECTNKKYKTPQGIKVGDTIKKLFKVLGKSEIWKTEEHREVQYALWPPCDTYMIFELDQGTISKIILDYIP